MGSLPDQQPRERETRERELREKERLERELREKNKEGEKKMSGPIGNSSSANNKGVPEPSRNNRFFGQAEKKTEKIQIDIKKVLVRKYFGLFLILGELPDSEC